MIAAISLAPLVVIAQDSGALHQDGSIPAATPNAVPGEQVVETAPNLDSAAPTAVPTQVPAAVASTIPNTDTITLAYPTDQTVLTARQHHELALVYTATTPRIDTTVTAELRATDGSAAVGWLVQTLTGAGDWLGDGPRAELVQPGAGDPGGTFEIVLRVTAPDFVDVPYDVHLFVWSHVTNELGELESGIDNGAPMVTLSVVPILPTEQPAVPGDDGGDRAGAESSAEPDISAPPSALMASPEPVVLDDLVGTITFVVAENDESDAGGSGSLACDIAEPGTVAAGGHVDLPCAFAGSGEPGGVVVTTSFSETTGDGWMLAIGEVSDAETRFGAAGDSAQWMPAQSTGGDVRADLIVRVFAPASADASHRSTIDVYLGDSSQPVATWSVAVDEEQMYALTSTMCNPTVEFTSPPIAWHTGRSQSVQHLVSEIAYQVTSPEACEWTVSLSATPFGYSGTHGGTAIDLSLLTFQSVRLEAGQGVREGLRNGSLTRPKAVLSADASAQGGTVEHALSLTLKLPGDAVPGHYSSTVTITVTGNGDPGG